MSKTIEKKKITRIITFQMDERVHPVRGVLCIFVYLGPGQKLSNETDGLQVALSKQQPPLLHGDLHLQLLLLLLLLSPHLLQVPPLLSLPQLQLSLSYPLFLPPLLLLLFLLLLLPEQKGKLSYVIICYCW